MDAEQETPDIMATEYQCPTCNAIFGPIHVHGIVAATMTIQCHGVTVEIVVGD